MANNFTHVDDDDITAKKIYEVLQSADFLQKLWWDLIADLKEKPSYKYMKAMIEKILTKQTGVITSIPTNDIENYRRRAVITELCTISYTVDTVFSKVLYARLESLFPKLVEELIEEIKQNAKENSACEPVSEENSGKTKIKHETVTPSKKKSPDASTDLKINKSAVKKMPARRGRQQQFVNFENRNTEVLNKDKNLKTYDSSNRKEIQTKKLENIDKESDTESAIESDTESAISVGKFSITSVSSVHTSELSSFDDEISISDEEENGKLKKKLSLDKVKEMVFSGRVSDKEAAKLVALKRAHSSVEEKEDNRKLVDKKKEKTKVTTSDDEKGTPTESVPVETPQKTLPPRIRKPNSKYSSNSIICPLAHIQQKRVHSTMNGKNADLECESSQKKKKLKSVESNKNTEDKSSKKSQQNTSVCEKSVQNNSGNCSKQQITSDSYKPRSTYLTTRKSAPITLFSTAMDKS